jgi:DNA-binding transcriptional regulator LsrR (DeoR family)
MAQIAKYREAQIELERIHLRAVGALLANGWTNRRIADLLNLSQWQARKLARQARENGLV